MRLLIDLGNSRLKWRWYGQATHADGVLAHQGAQLHPNLATALATARGLQIHISSVARPALREQLKLILQTLQAHQDWLVSPAAGLGLRNSYALPHKLGIDRWLAIAAAYAKTGKACCVVDIGTAITVDVCDASGQHQGGLIAPGPVALSKALIADTALPMAAETLPDELGLATDTEIALQYGALHAACGVIDRAYAIAKQKHGCSRVVLTGGGAPALAPYLQMPSIIAPDLVFQGLALHADAFQSQN